MRNTKPVSTLGWLLFVAWVTNLGLGQLCDTKVNKLFAVTLWILAVHILLIKILKMWKDLAQILLPPPCGDQKAIVYERGKRNRYYFLEELLENSLKRVKNSWKKVKKMVEIFCKFSAWKGMRQSKWVKCLLWSCILAKFLIKSRINFNLNFLNKKY